MKYTFSIVTLFKQRNYRSQTNKSSLERESESESLSEIEGENGSKSRIVWKDSDCSIVTLFEERILTTRGETYISLAGKSIT